MKLIQDMTKDELQQYLAISIKMADDAILFLNKFAKIVAQDLKDGTFVKTNAGIGMIEDFLNQYYELNPHKRPSNDPGK